MSLSGVRPIRTAEAPIRWTASGWPRSQRVVGSRWAPFGGDGLALVVRNAWRGGALGGVLEDGISSSSGPRSG